MRLILLGSPGSGKGTQAKLLSERLGLTHIGTGDILREAIKLQTPAGKLAEPYLLSGQLVPDSLVNELVNDRFRRDERLERFVMDGYPRTLAQAAAFDQVLRQQFLDLNAVILLAVDDQEIVRRLGGRWSCPRCKATYHTTSKPPRVFGRCDLCNESLVQRADDQEATIRQRLCNYHKDTEAVVAHYRAQNLLTEVDGAQDIEDIYAAIVKVLNLRAKPTC